MQLPCDAGDARRLSARLLLAFVVLALAVLGFGEARAQDYSGCYGDGDAGLCPDRALAYDRALAVALSKNTRADTHPTQCTHVTTESGLAAGHARYRCTYRNIGGNAVTRRDYPIANECPAGQTWNETTNRCDCPSGEIRGTDGTCRACSSLNSDPGFLNAGESTRSFSETCVAGCAFAVTGPSVCTTLAGNTTCSGKFEFTGAGCSVPPGDPEPQPEDLLPHPKATCVPADAGQTFCLKADGKHCYTASTGREICWNPGETGDKGDGPVLQTRGPGPTVKPPANPTTAGGDEYQSQGSPVTVTTTRGSSTITTTTANYTTVNGTDADNQRDGGEEGSEDSSAGGGGSCDAPPIVSDPALEMIATQAWATRCAVEAGNAASVTGDVGDCASPFSVEGDNANAAQLRALRVQICGSLGAGDNADASDSLDGLDGAAAGIDGEDAELDGIGADVEDAADPANWREVRDLNAQMADLDDSGFIGSRSCPIAPAVDVNGIALGLNFDPICNMFINMSGLLIALAYVIAARIIAGVR